MTLAPTTTGTADVLLASLGRRRLDIGFYHRRACTARNR